MTLPTSLRLLLAACAVACAASGCVPADADPTAGAGRAVTLAGPVRAVDSGSWRTIRGCSAGCVWSQYFWVDLAVRDDAYDKEVGILWTADDWATVHTASASYEADLGDGYERWGVDVDAGLYSDLGGGGPDDIAFAAFARMAGQTHWDPYNDHYIFRPVSEDRPVRLLASSVAIEDGAAVLAGRVRVFDFAYDKRVAVRYTTDAWTTWREVDATWVRDDDWRFRAPLAPAGALPGEVEFAVRYEAAGGQWWDNRGGANHRHALAPAFAFTAPDLDGAPLAGIVRVSATARTDLPVAGVAHRVDAGAWRAGATAVLSTEGMADGWHRVTFRARLGSDADGVDAAGSYSFAVRNRLAPLRPNWDPGAGDATWGVAVGGDGTVYLQVDGRGVVRYPPGGGETAYEPVSGRVWDLAVDAAGRVYGLENHPGYAVWRWNPDGTVDRGFGDGGRLDLGAEFAGHGFDSALAIAWGAGRLWVAGGCFRYGSRCEAGRPSVNAFDDGGALVAFTELPADAWPQALWIDGAGPGGTAWVADGAGGRLFAVRGGAVVATVDLEGEVHPRGLARAAGTWYVVDDGPSRLAAFDAGGRFIAHWLFGGTGDLPGGVDLPRHLVRWTGGELGVLDVEHGRVVRFAPLP